MLNIVLFKGTFFTFYDPLFIYVFLNSFSISFVIYLYFFIKSISFVYFITFVISNIAFIIGVRIGSKSLFTGSLELVGKDKFNRYSELFDIILFLSICVILMSNAILFIYKGIPLFSENPSDAKVQLFTGGFGIVRRINFSLTIVAIVIIYLKLFHPVLRCSRKRIIILIIYLLLCLLVMASSGSKGAILAVISPLCFLYVINRFYDNNNVAIKIRKVALIMLVTAFIYALLVIFLSTMSDLLLYNLYIRLVSSGDTFYYFYTFDLLNYFDFNVIDYIYRSLNTALGMFRIVEHEKAIGELIISYVFGRAPEGFGPNAQHPIEGLIYFGKYFAWLYSLLIGYIIAYSRTWILYNNRNNPHFMNLFFYIIISLMTVFLATESALFFDVLFDTIFFLSPILIVAYIIHHAIGLKLQLCEGQKNL